VAVQTIRPNANVKLVGVTVVGVSAFDATNDSPDDDTTYIRALAGTQYPNAYAILGLTSMGAVSATQRIKALRIRARGRMNSSVPGDAAYVDVKFRDRFTWRGTQDIGLWRFTTGNASSFVAFTGGWQTTCPPSSNSGLPNAEWSKTVVDRIDIFLAWFYGKYGSENLRISELYVDVDVRDQPTVTAGTATNTTSTRPTFPWTYNANADGDAQVASRVKAFSAAQYGITGFDPATSPNTWDSGSVAGPTESRDCGVDLVNGVTYKFYVQAAQDFNGTQWWSPWAASAAFTISLTPPATPTLTVTPDASIPWVRNILKVQAGLNMLTAQQASLEDGTTTGWAAGTNTTLANSAPATPPHGVKALQLTRTTSIGTASATTSPAAAIPARAGQQYAARAQFRAAATPRSTQVSIVWKRADGSTISTSVSSTAADTTTDWSATPSIVATAPAETTSLDVLVEVLSCAVSEVHHVDAVQVAPGSATTFGVGGLLGGAWFVVESSWATITPDNYAHPQLWGGGDGALRNASGFFITGTGSQVTYDTSDRFHGQGSIRCDIANGFTALYFGWPSSTNVDLAPLYALAAVPGRTYTFSVSTRASTSFAGNFAVQALDRDGNTVGSAASGSVTHLTGWTRFSRTITVPAGAVYVRPQLDLGSGLGFRLWVDGCQWELGSAATALSQPGGQPTVWTGVRGAGAGDLATGGTTGELMVPTGDEAVTLFDHEAPPGYTVTYRVRLYAVDPATAQVLSSDVSAYVQTMLDPPGVYILGSVQPATAINRMQVTVGDWSESQHEEATTFYPLRPASLTGGQRPVVVSDFLGGIDGTLEISAKTEDEFLLLRQLVQTPGTLFLIHHDFGARYLRITDRGWSKDRIGPPDTWLRRLTLPYVEAGRPA
jgi:hypothetical protein